jgi:hypothetical protein
VTGQREVGVKGAATLLGRSFLLYPVPPMARSKGASATDFGRIHFRTKMTMSRKRLLVEDAG